jgi:hypothetical protein
LNNDSDNVLPWAVEASAKYQWEAVVEAQGAVVRPMGPSVTWDTPTPPPFKTTVDATAPPTVLAAGTTPV